METKLKERKGERKEMKASGNNTNKTEKYVQKEKKHAGGWKDWIGHKDGGAWGVARQSKEKDTADCINIKLPTKYHGKFGG